MRSFVLLALLFPAVISAHPDPSHTLEQLEEHLREAPEDQALLRQKADLFLSTGHPEEAGAVVGKLLELDSKESENVLLDARLSASFKKPDEALTKVKALIDSQPKSAPGWNLLSRIEHEAGRRDEAIAANRRYLELARKPGPTEVMTCASWLRERDQPGDAEAALEILDQGLARLGCLSGLHYSAIGIELGMKRYESALRRIDALTARYRPSVDLAMRRTEILEKAGRHREAAESCDSALALLEALPGNRKKNAPYQEQVAAITKRKADNLKKAGNG